jgi:hypothetical protein
MLIDETPCVLVLTMSPKEVQEVSGAPGAKIFVHSPYDCVVAVKRDLADHEGWSNSTRTLVAATCGTADASTGAE